MGDFATVEVRCPNSERFEPRSEKLESPAGQWPADRVLQFITVYLREKGILSRLGVFGHSPHAWNVPCCQSQVSHRWSTLRFRARPFRLTHLSWRNPESCRRPKTPVPLPWFQLTLATRVGIVLLALATGSLPSSLTLAPVWIVRHGRCLGLHVLGRAEEQNCSSPLPCP